jgi:lipopolysaccharide transport system ATP-binding protein
MSNIAVRAESISKKYVIKAGRVRYRTLRDQIVDNIGSLVNRNGRKYAQSEEFWALRNVSFEMKHGEVLGLIGGNGAGKSTLLKILSRITEPTSGRAKIFGRVASLLEVGTGFHPELTGRENVYLYGAILGMKKAEIDAKFDEIVAFSDVEKFIQTPVKHYSSGMHVRLAFAVAAHLDPEILLVDEVLAVGDAAFQKKCLGKMNDVAKGGRTVIFVSHNMGSIANLCDRALWLDSGEIKLSGDAPSVISKYLSSGAAVCSTWTRPLNAPTDEAFQILSIRVLADSNNEPSTVVDFDKPFKVEVRYDLYQRMRDLVIAFRLKDPEGNIICGSWDSDTNGYKAATREPGCYQSTCKMPGVLLKPGRYFLTIFAHNSTKVLETHNEVVAFDVSSVGYHFNTGRAGVITPLLNWKTVRVDEGDRARTGSDYV